MSFGFSAGDFLAAGKLIHNIIQSLQDVGGAKSEYQELMRELRSLEKALQHLDNLQNDSSSQDRTVQSIKFAALSCRQPLEQFFAKIKKFDGTLDVWAKGQTSKSIVRKVHWGLGMKSEVTKLQGYLNLHIATINMLLAEHSLEKMSLAQKRADSDSSQVREMLDAAQDGIERIRNTVVGQAVLIQHTHAAMRSLMNMICGEFRTSWTSLGQTVAQLCVSMQQMYGVVLEIKASITPVDTRFTFFQTPLACEDALGFKYPIPSEWDYGMVENHIRYRFREGIGSRDVRAGNWELFKTKNSEDVISPFTRLLPGLEITMAIIVTTPPVLSDETCPIFSCRSRETTLAPSRGRICCTCGTYFSRATKKRIGLEALAEAIDSRSSETTHGGTHSDSIPLYWGKDVQNDSILRDEQNGLKNVRWSEEEEDLQLPPSDDESDVEFPGRNDIPPSLNPSDPPGPVLDDALSYLDHIKVTFREAPSVYNSFLDVMAGFRRGIIDTPRVMALVAELFRGETVLINGFNAFLPPGYELQTDSDWGPYTVRMITPDGTTQTSPTGAKRKQLNELDDSEESGFSKDAMVLVDPGTQRRKRRRGQIPASP
ncbi:hypothetical protein DM02DRAFT_580489 [Periconia macrospinosa]|uniref:Fungal N-terminal domain-containing protein n=1 Tax=Periconia macrospinosa TaxID=97972 RepID=A0A2V1EAT2_9PLEO|nr:hypothetical protein DM02DRAFT_580489 [Periconia macrospinosa]